MTILGPADEPSACHGEIATCYPCSGCCPGGPCHPSNYYCFYCTGTPCEAAGPVCIPHPPTKFYICCSNP